MALELEGKIISKLPVQTGTSARGPWSKQEFVLEYQEGNYPTQVCMNVWGEDKVKDLERFNAGDSRQPRLQLTELPDLPLQQAPECLNHHRHLLPHRLISMLPELTLTTFRSDFMHPAGCKTNIAPKLRHFCNFGAIFFSRY